MEQEIDYEHFDERFENFPVQVGSQLDEIDLRQREYIANNISNYKPKVNVTPVEGLRPHLNRKTPQTAMWYKKLVSHERSGRL